MLFKHLIYSSKNVRVVHNVQVIVNLWSAHMDPNVWEEPEIFRPDRFLNDIGEVINRDKMIAFSLGMYSFSYFSFVCFR